MNLKSSLVVSLFILATITSCKDEETVEPLISLEEFIADHNITGLEETPSGLLYEIVKEGEGDTIEEGDIVVSEVLVSSLTGTIYYDSESLGPWHYEFTEETFLTAGMLEGVPLINVGGDITLYLKSELAYGEEGVINAGIRPNEDLIVIFQHNRIKMSIADYIVENELENVMSTASGLHYVIEEQGEGNLPVDGQKVTVDYTGKFFNGTQFDSSKDTGREPFELIVGESAVIEGWVEGIPLFNKGSKGILLIPYDMAYGAAGRIDQATGTYAIDPYEPLMFEIELIDIE